MNLRDYGLGDAGKPLETPTWKLASPEVPCPNCGAKLCEVSMLAENKLLKGGSGMMRYLGCPACPFASPAITTTLGTPEKA